MKAENPRTWKTLVMVMMYLVSTFASVFRSYSTRTPKSSYKTFRYRPQNTNNSKLICPSRNTIWTNEQCKVLDATANGKSVFITGAAGTGKTLLLEEIIMILRKKHRSSSVFVTASTGVAACAIGGQTLHSFAGIGLGVGDRMVLADRVCSNKRSLKRWRKAKALVIDEVSMIDPDLFDNLEFIARLTRGGNEAWGGLQLVVAGDFFQLPPVLDYSKSNGKEFAFEAECWNFSVDLQVELTENFRQSDCRLIKLLQGIRRGQCDEEDLKLLKQCCSNSDPDDSVIRMYPKNEQVREVNNHRISNLGEQRIEYVAFDEGKAQWKKQLNHMATPDKLVLCKDARVMLTKNINTQKQLVNGATGVVSHFRKTKRGFIRKVCAPDQDGNYQVPIVKFDSGIEIEIRPERFPLMDGDIINASRTQIPLVLAWATSIHKCQGMTLDRLHTDLSKAFGYGMLYVALSRVRSIEGLCLSGIKPSKIKAHPKVLEFYQRINEGKSEDDPDSHILQGFR